MSFGVARLPNSHPMDQFSARLVLLFLGTIMVLVSSYLVTNQRWGGLVALLAACCLMILACRPFMVLAVMFAFLPFQGLLTDIFSPEVGWVAICKDLLVVWAFVLVLLHFATGRPMKHSGGIAACLMVIAGVAAIYVLVAPDLLRAVLGLRGIVLYPAIAVTVMYCLQDQRDLRNLLRVVVLVGAVTTIYGILQYFYAFDQSFRSSWSDLSFRQLRFGTYGVTSTFPGRPDFGGYLIALTLLVWQVRLWKSSISGVLLRILILAGALVCLFWTYSRTSWVALLVGVCVALLLRNKVKAAVGVLALGILISWFYTTHLAQISATTQQATTDYGSFIERLDYWNESFQLVRENPLGYGLGTVGGALVIESPSQEKPQQNVLLFIDNAYLKLLLQGGVPLCAAFLVLFGFIVRLIFTLLRSVHDPWLKDVAIWASASFAVLLTILWGWDYMEATTSIAIYWLAVGVLGWQFSLTRPHRTRQLRRSITPEGSQ